MGIFRPACIQNFFFFKIEQCISESPAKKKKKESNLNILLGHQSSGLDRAGTDESLLSLVVKMWPGQRAGGWER